MPKWQSMQVLPSALPFACRAFARSDCRSELIASAWWQLRHSSESVSFIRVQTCVASSYRCASNFSLVSMTPVSLPQISKVASTLRQIIGPGSRGTWQSGQIARTPVRFVSWIVPLYSV